MALGPRVLALAIFGATIPTEAGMFGDPDGECFEKSLAYAENKPPPLQPQGGFVASATSCQISCSGMWWCRYFTWYKDGTPELPTKGACWFFGKDASTRSLDGTIGGPKYSTDCTGIDATATVAPGGPSTTAPKGGVVPVVPPPPVVAPAGPGSSTTEQVMPTTEQTTEKLTTSTEEATTTTEKATSAEKPGSTEAAEASTTPVLVPSSSTGVPGARGVVIPPAVPVVVPAGAASTTDADRGIDAVADASTTEEGSMTNSTFWVAGDEGKKPWWGWILIILGILLLLLAACLAYFICLGWADPSKKRKRSPLDKLRSSSSVNNSDAEDTSRELLQGQAVQHRELHITGRQPPTFAGAPMMTGRMPGDLFDQIDTNHDGRISHAEFEAANPYGMLLPGTSAAQLGYAALQHPPQLGGLGPCGAALPAAPAAGLMQVTADPAQHQLPVEPVTVMRPGQPVSRQSSQPPRPPPRGIR